MRNPNPHIRSKIKALLKAKGISAEKLAYESEVSKAFMYGYLAGADRHKDIGAKTLAKIAEGLEISMKDLLPD
jgi:transcriptional regulator with XRE-family HTH domain